MPVDRDSSVGSQPPGQDAAADFFSAVPLYMASMPDAQAGDIAAPVVVRDYFFLDPPWAAGSA